MAFSLLLFFVLFGVQAMYLNCFSLKNNDYLGGESGDSFCLTLYTLYVTDFKR